MRRDHYIALLAGFSGSVLGILLLKILGPNTWLALHALALLAIWIHKDDY